MPQAKGNRQHDNLLIAGYNSDPAMVKNAHGNALRLITLFYEIYKIAINFNKLNFYLEQRQSHVAKITHTSKSMKKLIEKLRRRLILQRYNRLVIGDGSFWTGRSGSPHATIPP